MLVAVPCSEDDCVVLLDAERGTEQGRIAVGAHPVHLTTVDGRTFVATMGERAVSVVVDGRVERVETGVLGPSHFATTDGEVLVPCTGGDVLTVIDVERLELRDRIGVGAEPHDVAVRDGLAFVGSRADGTVTVVDPSGGTVHATHEFDPEARIQGVEAASEYVYAVDQRNARLHRLTVEGIESSWDVGANPYDAVVNDSRVLVAGRGDGTVTEVPRGATGESGPGEARTREVGGTPADVALAAGNAWVLDRERPRLVALDSDRSGERQTVDLPFPSFAAAVHPTDDTRLYVSHYDDDAVSAVDVAAGRVTWTAETAARPFEPEVI